MQLAQHRDSNTPAPLVVLVVPDTILVAPGGRLVPSLRAGVLTMIPDFGRSVPNRTNWASRPPNRQLESSDRYSSSPAVDNGLDKPCRFTAQALQPVADLVRSWPPVDAANPPARSAPFPGGNLRQPERPYQRPAPAFGATPAASPGGHPRPTSAVGRRPRAGRSPTDVRDRPPDSLLVQEDLYPNRDDDPR